jgi:hypothetical protein
MKVDTFAPITVGHRAHHNHPTEALVTTVAGAFSCSERTAYMLTMTDRAAITSALTDPSLDAELRAVWCRSKFGTYQREGASRGNVSDTRFGQTGKGLGARFSAWSFRAQSHAGNGFDGTG